MQASITRRSLIQFAGVATAAATTSGLLASIANADTVSGDMYWELVRHQFIFPDTAIPMNSANLCPSFQSVADKVAGIRIGFTDVRLIYDYFRLQGGNYDAFDPLNLTSVKVGRNSVAGSYPDKDRSHVDYYILHPDRNVPGGNDPVDGRQPSDFESANEDTSTGSTIPLHENSMHVRGVADAALDGMSWTRTTSPLVWRFNHELQHGLHGPQDHPGAWSTEMFSAGAEAIGGVPRGAPPRNDVPYTHSLVAFGAGNGCLSPDLGYGQAYQQRSLFASYLAYNFRGSDTTTVRPADPSTQVGLGDDLLWRWARTGRTTRLPSHR